MRPDSSSADPSSGEIPADVLRDPVEASDEDGEDGTIDAERTGARQSTALTTGGRGDIVPADPFRRYMAEIGKYPPLDREQERELARRYRDTGDRDALFRLVSANLMLVVRIALSFRRAARNLLDLIQEGNIGLLHAIERFDPELGVRLPTYAAWWVRAYMVKFLLDNVRLVRVGTTNARRKLLRNLRQEKARLESMGVEVGPRLLAEHFGVSEEDVRDVQSALSSRDVSLEEPLPGTEDRRQADVLADERPGHDVEEVVARRELQERASAAIGAFRQELGERDRVLLDDRILSDEPKTLQEIGDRFGTTREAVRQAEARLKKKLEAFLRERLDDVDHVEIG